MRFFETEDSFVVCIEPNDLTLAIDLANNRSAPGAAKIGLRKVRFGRSLSVDRFAVWTAPLRPIPGHRGGQRSQDDEQRSGQILE